MKPVRHFAGVHGRATLSLSASRVFLVFLIVSSKEIPKDKPNPNNILNLVVLTSSTKQSSPIIPNTKFNILAGPFLGLPHLQRRRPGSPPRHDAGGCLWWCLGGGARGRRTGGLGRPQERRRGRGVGTGSVGIRGSGGSSETSETELGWIITCMRCGMEDDEVFAVTLTLETTSMEVNMPVRGFSRLFSAPESREMWDVDVRIPASCPGVPENSVGMCRVVPGHPEKMLPGRFRFSEVRHGTSTPRCRLDGGSVLNPRP